MWQTYLWVSLGELALVIQSSDGCWELWHWMEGGWEVVKHCNNMSWQSGAVGPFTWQIISLSLVWNVAGDQEPEKTFGQWFCATWSLRQNLLAFRNRQAAETDSLIWIQDRCFGDETLDASHASVHLENSWKISLAFKCRSIYGSVLVISVPLIICCLNDILKLVFAIMKMKWNQNCNQERWGWTSHLTFCFKCIISLVKITWLLNFPLD